ncbi:MAG: ATP synthase F1 subunit epsilon [Planctomycetota bacterium]|nr:MAG: ATP synthase F1 subunit epsilon [Planctomycetota bacterium]
MRLEIVTPDKSTYEGDVNGVVYMAPHGEVGILPGHAPFFSLIKPCELIIDEAGQSKSLAVGSGFVEVTTNAITILTDMAMNPEEINEQITQEALERAQDAVKNTEITDEEKEKHMIAIEKSLAVLRVKRKHM